MGWWFKSEIGLIEIEEYERDEFSLHINGRSLKTYPHPIFAVEDLQDRNTGCEMWDMHTPALRTPGIEDWYYEP